MQKLTVKFALKTNFKNRRSY